MLAVVVAINILIKEESVQISLKTKLGKLILIELSFYELLPSVLLIYFTISKNTQIKEKFVTIVLRSNCKLFMTVFLNFKAEVHFSFLLPAAQQQQQHLYYSNMIFAQSYVCLQLAKAVQGRQVRVCLYYM